MAPTNAEYAKINIACKELGIDKYDLIADRYSIESTKQLTKQQTRDLLEHLKTLGFKVKRKSKPDSYYYQDPRARKVYMLWKTLAEAGVVKSRSRKALDSFVKRQTGIDSLRFVESHYDFTTLIEALKTWGLREGVDLD